MHLKSSVFIILLLFSSIISPVLAGSAGDEQEIVSLCGDGNRVVELEAKIYMIGNSFELPSNIELIGQDGTCFMLKAECGIPQNVPMISIKNQKDITIRNIRFEGQQDKQSYALKYSNPNHPSQSGKKAYGNQVNTFIYAINCENITVTECEGNDNLGDFLRCSGCKNIEFSYNSASMGGHDVFFALRSTGIRAHHNRIKTLVNAAVRLLDCTHARIYNNIISWEGPRDAGPAIQIQHDSKPMGDIEILGNKIYSSCGPGSWVVAKPGVSGNEDVTIRYNLFQNCGDNRITWVAGIIASGYNNMKVEDNVFDGCYRGSVVFYAVNSAWATEADAVLSKNIFTNAKAGQLDGKGPYGVENTISKQDVELSENCFYNNQGGNVIGCKLSDSDIFVNPKKEETPSSWIWDGSEWSCPEVSPSDMEGIPGDFTPLLDQEIEDAEQAARDFEFNDIFDVMYLDFTEQADKNSKVILPEGVLEENKESITANVSYYETQTLVSLSSTEGLTSVHVIADGNESIHTLMLGEKLGTSVFYTNVSIWKGEHFGDAFSFNGNPNNIQVTCNTPKGSFEPPITTEIIESSNNVFSPLILVYFFMLFIFLGIFFVSWWILFKK